MGTWGKEYQCERLIMGQADGYFSLYLQVGAAGVIRFRFVHPDCHKLSNWGSMLAHGYYYAAEFSPADGPACAASILDMILTIDLEEDNCSGRRILESAGRTWRTYYAEEVKDLKARWIPRLLAGQGMAE